MRNQSIFHKKNSTIIYFSLFLSLLFIIDAFRQTSFLKRNNNVCFSIIKRTNKLYSRIGDDSKSKNIKAELYIIYFYKQKIMEQSLTPKSI